MIEVSHLSKKYGSNLAVDDLTFKVESGRIYGFLGPNGAGKSTTMNIITGCLAPTSGEVLINGYSIVDDPIEAKSCIGYLPELPPLYVDMTPEEYLTFVAEAKGIERDRIASEVALVMEETDITDVSYRLIRNLSKGYRQRVGIAQAMLGSPDVIILDEPTVGLDPQQIIEIRDLIRSLGREHTVILSSHILTEVASVCDYIIVINHGRLVANDTMENISRLMKSDINMKLTVKCTEAEAADVLSGIDGITSFSFDGGEGDAVKVKVKYPTELDLREEISTALFGAHHAVLAMSIEEEGLEEIFLKLTEADAAAESDGDDSDDDDGDVADVIDTDDDNDDDDDGNEYVYNPEDYAAGATEYRIEDGDDDGASDEHKPQKNKNDQDDDYKPLFGGK